MADEIGQWTFRTRIVATVDLIIGGLAVIGSGLMTMGVIALTASFNHYKHVLKDMIENYSTGQNSGSINPDSLLTILWVICVIALLCSFALFYAGFKLYTSTTQYCEERVAISSAKLWMTVAACELLVSLVECICLGMIWPILFIYIPVRGLMFFVVYKYWTGLKLNEQKKAEVLAQVVVMNSQG